MAEEKKTSAAKGDATSTEAKAPKKATTKSVVADKAATSSAAAPKAAAARKTSTADKGEKTPAKAGTSKAAAAKDDSKAEKPAAKSTPAKKPAAKKAADVPARPQVLKVHHLRPAAGAKKDRTRVGRGEGSKGKTAGRGTKGTKARYQVRPGFQGGQLPFHMRSPKLRGFKNPFRVEYQVVNLEKLAELYPSGGDVTVSDLVAKGAVRKNEKVKVLGGGDISVKLNVAVDKVSGSAEQKILAAGGSVK
jgi:large subunit ribosomal protein L15